MYFACTVVRSNLMLSVNLLNYIQQFITIKAPLAEQI
jgi:hypothetical protein